MSTKLEIMTEGGKRHAKIKEKLQKIIKVGITPKEIDALAEKLILENGDKPSFKMVKGYHHATCININDGMVHGIPDDTPLKDGDVVKVDSGVFHEGYHTDSAFTLLVGEKDSEKEEFIKVGQEALNNAIFMAIPGNSVYDISKAIEDTIKVHGYSVIRDLTGHGVGRELHMDPFIPCFTDTRNKKDILSEGQTLAIEVMYAKGKPDLTEDKDNWTLRTQDGSITGMWEQTVFVTKDSPIILTE